MKKILLIPLLLILFATCAEPPDLIQEKFIVTGYDFTKYSDKGFLFTPNEYNGEYQSMGLIQLTYMPEAKLVTVYVSSLNSEGKPITIKKKKWKIDPLNVDKVIEDIYNLCMTMGANALTQMDIEPYSENHAQGTTKPITITGIKISGFAIKRLGAFK